MTSGGLKARVLRFGATIKAGDTRTAFTRRLRARLILKRLDTYGQLIKTIGAYLARQKQMPVGGRGDRSEQPHSGERGLRRTDERPVVGHPAPGGVEVGRVGSSLCSQA